MMNFIVFTHAALARFIASRLSTLTPQQFQTVLSAYSVQANALAKSTRHD